MRLREGKGKKNKRIGPIITFTSGPSIPQLTLAWLTTHPFREGEEEGGEGGKGKGGPSSWRNTKKDTDPDQNRHSMPPVACAPYQ